MLNLAQGLAHNKCLVAINVGTVAAEVMGLQVQEGRKDRSGKSMEADETQAKASAPDLALERTLSEPLDVSVALSAEAVYSHL